MKERSATTGGGQSCIAESSALLYYPFAISDSFDMSCSWLSLNRIRPALGGVAEQVCRSLCTDWCTECKVECRGRAAPFPLLPLCCSHFLAQRDHDVSQRAPLTRPTTSVRSEIVTFRWSTIPLLHTTHRRSDASPVYALSSPSLTSPAPAQVFHLRIAAATGLSRHLIVCEGLSNSRRTLPLAATARAADTLRSRVYKG